MAVRLGGDKMLCRGDESPFQTAQLGLILFTHPDKSCRESTEPSLVLSPAGYENVFSASL